MGLGEIGHVIAWRILPPHTIAAHSAALIPGFTDIFSFTTFTANM